MYLYYGLLMYDRFNIYNSFLHFFCPMHREAAMPPKRSQKKPSSQMRGKKRKTPRVFQKLLILSPEIQNLKTTTNHQTQLTN